MARAAEAGIEVITLTPREGDFNDDLQRLGIDAFRARLKDRLHPEDARRFLDH